MSMIVGLWYTEEHLSLGFFPSVYYDVTIHHEI